MDSGQTQAVRMQSLPSNYQYKPILDEVTVDTPDSLPNDHLGFRLLQIEPGEGIIPLNVSLVHSTFGKSNRKYDAISYVWGDPTDTTTIEVDGVPIQVTKSLASALRRVRRRHEVRTVWADAICINQQDIIERATQVQRMGLIYCRAKQVLACLDGEGDDGKLVGNLLGVLVMMGGSTPEEVVQAFEELLANEKYKSAWLALREFSRHPWHTRAWVVQEVSLNNMVEILYGDGSIHWNTIHGGFHLVYQALFGNHGTTVDKKRYGDKVQYLLDLGPGTYTIHSTLQMKSLYDTARMGEYRGKKHIKKLPMSHLPFMIMEHQRLRKATDDRDFVYSILSLASGHHDIIPDYTKTVAEVYIDVVLDFFSREQSLSFLHFMQYSPESSDVPSWCPAWNIVPRDARVPFIHYSAASTLPVEVKFSGKELKVKGHVFGKIGAGDIIVWGQAGSRPRGSSMLQTLREFETVALARAIKRDPNAAVENIRSAVRRTLIADTVHMYAREKMQRVGAPNINRYFRSWAFEQDPTFDDTDPIVERMSRNYFSLAVTQINPNSPGYGKKISKYNLEPVPWESKDPWWIPDELAPRSDTQESDTDDVNDDALLAEAIRISLEAEPTTATNETNQDGLKAEAGKEDERTTTNADESPATPSDSEPTTEQEAESSETARSQLDRILTGYLNQFTGTCTHLGYPPGPEVPLATRLAFALKLLGITMEQINDRIRRDDGGEEMLPHHLKMKHAVGELSAFFLKSVDGIATPDGTDDPQASGGEEQNKSILKASAADHSAGSNIVELLRSPTELYEQNIDGADLPDDFDYISNPDVPREEDAETRREANSETKGDKNKIESADWTSTTEGSNVLINVNGLEITMLNGTANDFELRSRLASIPLIQAQIELNRLGPRYPDGEPVDFKDLYMDIMKDDAYAQESEEIHPQNIPKLYGPMLHINGPWGGKHLFMLGDEYLVLGPSETEIGDEIAFFWGHEMPWVMRRVADAGSDDGDREANVRHRLIGPCYVHGYMDGEIVEEVKGGGRASVDVTLV